MEIAIDTNQLVTFQIEDDLFGIDIMTTQEILTLANLRQIPNAPFYFEGILNLRGEIITIINFKRLFHFGTFDLSTDKGIIILRKDNQLIGIVIDKILRVLTFEQSSIKSVPQGFSKLLKQYILGVIEKQGELISILDVKSIFEVAQHELDFSYGFDTHYLNFQRDKLENLTINDEKVIANFLNSINFNSNHVTKSGTNNYFAQLKITRKVSISTILQKEQDMIEQGIGLFNKEKAHLFFDREKDYLFFLSILKQIIIPTKEKNKDQSLKIINMSCRKGEELYSILFILNSFLPNFDKWDIELIGIDDKFNNLTFATEALYSKDFLIKINKNEYPLLFDQEDDQFRVNQELKDKVNFRIGTIKNFESIKDIDLFFCRGVLAQLEDNSINRVLSAVKDSLNSYGILLLSEIEDLSHFVNVSFAAKEINGRNFYVRT